MRRGVLVLVGTMAVVSLAACGDDGGEVTVGSSSSAMSAAGQDSPEPSESPASSSSQEESMTSSPASGGSSTGEKSGDTKYSSLKQGVAQVVDVRVKLPSGWKAANSQAEGRRQNYRAGGGKDQQVSVDGAWAAVADADLSMTTLLPQLGGQLPEYKSKGIQEIRVPGTDSAARHDFTYALEDGSTARGAVVVLGQKGSDQGMLVTLSGGDLTPADIDGIVDGISVVPAKG